MRPTTVVTLTAQAQIDPEPRKLLHLGVNQSLHNDGPMGAYAFYYWNMPHVPTTNQTLRLAIARIEDAWQIAFLVERLEAGHVAVFVPGAPSPQSGSRYFMTEDRIRLLDIPPAAATKCLKRYGLGSNALLGSRLSSSSQSGAAPVVTGESRKST